MSARRPKRAADESRRAPRGGGGASESLDLGEKLSHSRLLVSRVVVMDGIVGRGLVDGGVELLGYVSSGLGLASLNAGLEAPEVRLDGRLVTQVLQTLPFGDEHPLTLLPGISQSSFLPSSLQSRSSLA